MLPEKDPAHKLAIQPIEKRPLLKKSKTIELKGDCEVDQFVVVELRLNTRLRAMVNALGSRLM